MAIKNFFVKNKKKNICIALALLICISSIVGWRFANRTNASVFRKDKNGNSYLVDEIKILEIVAHEGQQVIGYTVDGQQPISKDEIEHYEGPMDLSDEDLVDFCNVTGYDLEKIDKGGGNFGYHVKGNTLKNTFNDNVLSQQMDVGQIVVRAVQANEVKVSDVDWADLIYLNSNDYSDNLLYYYDQFKYNGTMQLAKGDPGEGFNGIFNQITDKKLRAVSKIVNCLGYADKINDITPEDMDFLKYLDLDSADPVNLSNYIYSNHQSYMQGFLTMEEGTFSNNVEEAIRQINEYLATVNETEVNSAIEKIKDAPTNLSVYEFEGDHLSDEGRRQLVNDIQKLQIKGYTEYNADAYVEAVMSMTTGLTESQILGNEETGTLSIIEETNAEEALMALGKLAEYKAIAMAAIEAGGGTGEVGEPVDPESTELTDSFGLTPEDYANIYVLMQKADVGTIYSRYAKDYYTFFVGSEFVYTGADDAEALRTQITTINNGYYDQTAVKFADLPSNLEMIEAFKLTARDDFELLAIPGYNKYYINNYISAIQELYNNHMTDAFKTDGAFDITKAAAMIAEVNKTEVYDSSVVLGDISWTTAMAIYKRAISEDVALIYNTELMTSIDKRNRIGSYKEDMSANMIENEKMKEHQERYIDNTNNVYKMLLLIRQIRDSYFASELVNKIDEIGDYYPDGIAAGNTAISSWNWYTFAQGEGEDFNNYQKFREPEVVGTTYGEDGTEGAKENYIYKKIYCYSGSEFLGGPMFVAATAGGGSDISYVITKANYHKKSSNDILTPANQLEDSNYILIRTTNAAAEFKDKNPLYVHIWDNNNNDSGVTFYNAYPEVRNGRDPNKYDYYRFALPSGYNNFLVTIQNSWGGTQTTDYNATDRTAEDLYGKVYSINTITLSDDISGNMYAIAGIYNSINGGTVDFAGGMNMRFWSYASSGYNIKAKYRLYVNDVLVDAAGNPNGEHYTYSYGNNYNQPFSLTDEIRIVDSNTVLVGDDTIPLKDLSGNDLILGKNSVLKIELDYLFNNSTTVSRVYRYKKARDAYELNVTNFNANGTVDFVGSADFRFDYSGDTSNVQYSYQNGAWTNVANGEVVSLGSEIGEADTANLKIRYTQNGSTVTESTTLRKGTFSREVNYLSAFTATNLSSLAYDPLLSAQDNAMITTADKGGVIRYLLNVVLSEVTYPVNVLEIEPGASVSVLNTSDGAKRIADYLNINWQADGMNDKNYQNYIKVTSMGVKEFNTRNEDLKAKYDIIYFGIDTGYMLLDNNTKRTVFQDTSMNGMVYYGIGDKYGVVQAARGVAASDYKLLTVKENEKLEPNASKDYGSEAGFQTNHYESYAVWKNYFVQGFRGNSNPSWNLSIDPVNTNGSTVFYVLQDGTTTTRLSGNDITVMRKDDLLDYVKSGYPILLEDALMTADSDYWIDYDGNNNNKNRWRYLDRYSKLYAFIQEAKQLGLQDGVYKDSSQFRDGKTYASLVATGTAKTGKNPDYMSTADKFTGGLSYAYRRVSKVRFDYVSGPLEYEKDNSGNELAKNRLGSVIGVNHPNYTKFSFVLNIKRTGGVDLKEVEGQYTYNLYMDKSGVGRYEDDVTIDVEGHPEFVMTDGKVTQIKIDCNLPTGLEGFVPWRLEVANIKNPGLKYSYEAFSAFEAKDSKKKDVYVLWIYPKERGGSKYNLDLAAKLTDYREAIEQAGYNIHLIGVTYPKFNSIWADQTEYINNVNLEYNEDTTLFKVKKMWNQREIATNFTQEQVNKLDDDKEIDMLVAGFADSHEEMDFCNMAALKDMQYFIDAGHSMLYTHDNSSYWTTINWYTKKDNSRASGASWYWGRFSTPFFRKMLGMDQYGVTYGGPDSELPVEYANSRAYLNPSKMEMQDLRGATENFVFHYSTGAHDATYSKTLHGTTKDDYKDWCHTNRVMKTNRGQITEYPFLLYEYVPVTTTHTQYSTLCLEDPELTVWYTLHVHEKNNKAREYRSPGNNSILYTYTAGDGANNYYIYSKGNITYTGSGHTSGQTEDELRLFINTIIAALKAGNLPPTVDLKNASVETVGGVTKNVYNLYTTATGFDVVFNPIDFDYNKDDAFSDLKIYVNVDGTPGYNEDSDVLLNDTTSLISDVDGNPLTLTHDMLKNRQNQTFRLTLENLNAINAKIAAKDATKNVYNCEFVIDVWDKGLRKAKKPVPAKGSASFVIVKKEPPTVNYFNLN